MSVFLPNMYIKNVTGISVDMLKRNSIEGIILDVDNTLTTHGSQEVEQKVLDWLKTMEEHFKLIIVSNNTDSRIKPFAKKLGLDYVAFGCKPLKKGLVLASEKINVEHKKIAVIGDQIYTDILGGNLLKMYTVLVKPFKYEEELFFKIKRKLEKQHIKKYKKLHKNDEK